MRIVSIGDLVCDVYYDENKEIIGAFGGITACNIVCNLQNMGFNTYAYGVCGNDFLGKISIKSLDDCGVKNDISILDNIKTKAYHILKLKKDNRYIYRSIKSCPYCKESSWYEESFIKEKEIIKKIKRDDILIFDNLNDKNQFIIDNTSNTKLLDLGNYDEFINKTDTEIVKKMANKFAIINLNERVEKYLIEKLNCKNDIELSKIFKTKLIMITRGINGNDLVYRNRVYTYPLEKIIEEVDDSGAGDAFFSVIIKNWLNNNQKLEAKLFNKWINDTRSLIKKVLLQIGSRTHIKELYLVIKRDLCKGDGENE